MSAALMMKIGEYKKNEATQRNGGITTPGLGLQPSVETVLADRRYIGPYTFNADTLERVDFPGGYFDYEGKAHYMIRDWNSSVNMVVNGEGFIKQHTCYLRVRGVSNLAGI